MKKIVLISYLLFSSFLATAQQGSKDLVQFSGVVVSGDSLSPVPFTNIIIKDSRRGTMSDYYGFFSFVAQQGDTLEFSCVGYKRARYVIPDSLPTNRYSLIQMMVGDTVNLKENIVYPWPTREQFRDAFLNLNIVDDNYEIAMKNLERQQLKQQMEKLGMDGTENYYYQMQERQSKLYYAGQYPPINLLNPVAWAKFIEAWKKGEFKRK